MKLKWIIVLSLSIALIGVLTACSESGDTSEAQTNPEGHAEFIAAAEPGGGSDTILRLMSEIMMEEDIVDDFINVDNRPGGNGGVAMSHLYNQRGSGDHLILANSTFLTAPLQSDYAFNYEDFSPIALLGEQSYVIVVPADSEIETFNEYVEAAEEEDLIFGSYGVGTSDHMVAMLLDDAIGQEATYLPYQSAGEAFTGLLGGHIDASAQQIGSAMEYIESGDVTPIAVTSEERSEALPDVPTAKELGYEELTWSLYRVVYGPPDMSEEDQEYWSNAFEELSQNERWIEEYQEPQMLEPDFLAGDELEEYMHDFNEVFEENLREADIIE
ncbi:tripartite tricarboxylate transporter substrate binding protein [Salicibibacter cibarius]|uniref:Tripartite tricarboxylate transporter substrate binding protein n=1 Tax=Salicibibacter cibarius TaxID=2743000 RepID=A0A7T7CD86_9BACI|nr:tripartite tricarboxylate transporter substrate binding protein [Salicibibacter cibarius]QQK77720.1 tripartite tricarboxylate transporter substrate binding protein [Salicibibacter cibarius]